MSYINWMRLGNCIELALYGGVIGIVVHFVIKYW
jgi:hypothetical protein